MEGEGKDFRNLMTVAVGKARHTIITPSHKKGLGNGRRKPGREKEHAAVQ